MSFIGSKKNGIGALKYCEYLTCRRRRRPAENGLYSIPGSGTNAGMAEDRYKTHTLWYRVKRILSHKYTSVDNITTFLLFYLTFFARKKACKIYYNIFNDIKHSSSVHIPTFTRLNIPSSNQAYLGLVTITKSINNAGQIVIHQEQGVNSSN